MEREDHPVGAFDVELWDITQKGISGDGDGSGHGFVQREYRKIGETLISRLLKRRAHNLKDLYKCGKLSCTRYSDKHLIGITYTSAGN